MDTYDPENSLGEKPFCKEFDFEKCTLDDLKTVRLDFTHTIRKTAILHGYALYFDAYFTGADKTVILHTGPEHPATHWYQFRMLLQEPLAVNRGQTIPGKLSMDANDQQSYNGLLSVAIPELQIKVTSDYDMKDAEQRGCYQSYVDYYAQAGTK